MPPSYFVANARTLAIRRADRHTLGDDDAVLDHLRVLDATDDRGQIAGLFLAQLGADVVLCEPPGGTPTRRLAPFADPAEGTESLVHWSYNRGKRSVVVPDGATLAELAADADILLWTPGALGAVPVDLAALRAANPQLVTVAITPFGDDGPKADWAATDLTVAAASGQLVLTGDADRAPVRISEPQSFHHAALEGAIGALLAVAERARSGLGQHVDVSAQQSMTEATQASMLAAAVGALPYRRTAGGILVGPYKVRFVYPALDGHVSITLLFGAMVGPFTARLMAWVHERGFCDEATRDLDWVGFFELLFSGRLEASVLQQATDAVAAMTATMTKAEIMAEATARRLLVAPVATPADVVAEEQFRARGYWDRHAIAGRDVDLPGPFVRSSAGGVRRLGAPPTLGSGVRADAARPDGAPGTTTGVRPLDGPADDRRPLAGLRVADFSWAIAAPMSTRVLADWGATVVRVESLHRMEAIRGAGPFIAGTSLGIEDSAQWHTVGAGKYGIQLAMTTPEARVVARDLVDWADVVVESFTPGTMASWGLDAATVRAGRGDLVYVSSCLMGQTGPRADYAGFGNLAGAVTGFYELTGWPDRPPAGPFLAYTDYTSPRGTLVALLAALEHRRRTGEGTHLDFAQAEGALHFLAPTLAEVTAHGTNPTRAGNTDRRLAPHGVYPCAGEDRWVAVAVTDDHSWAALAALCGRPDLADLGVGDRASRSGEIDELVAAWTSAREAAACEAELQSAGVAAHRVQNTDELFTDPQLQHRAHFRQVPHPVHGTVWVEGPHLRLHRSPGGPAWGGPTLGQHTDTVLRDLLGYDDDRITELVIAGALE